MLQVAHHGRAMNLEMFCHLVDRHARLSPLNELCDLSAWLEAAREREAEADAVQGDIE